MKVDKELEQIVLNLYQQQFSLGVEKRINPAEKWPSTDDPVVLDQAEWKEEKSQIVSFFRATTAAAAPAILWVCVRQSQWRRHAQVSLVANRLHVWKP